MSTPEDPDGEEPAAAPAEPASVASVPAVEAAAAREPEEPGGPEEPEEPEEPELPSTEAADPVYPLRPFAPVRPAMVLAAGTVLLALGSLVAVGMGVQPGALDPSALVGTSVLLGAAASLLAVGGRSWWSLRQPAGQIVVEEQRVLLPKPFGGKPVWTPLSALTALELRARAGQPVLVVATRRRMWFLGGVRLQAGDAAVIQLFEALRARLKELPEGPAQIQAMDARLEAFAHALSRRPAATLIAVAALGVAYLFEVEQEVAQTPWGLVDLGANVPSLVEQGDLWRLASSNLLHASGWHLWINLVTILFVGAIFERLVGRIRYAIVLLGASLIGAAGSALFGGHLMSVGASTGALGLFGAMAMVQARFGAQVPTGLRQSRVWWAVLAGGALLLPFAQPHVDGWAHVVGFIAGAGLTFAVCPPDLRPGMPTSGGLVLQLVAASLLALFVGSATVAFSTETRPPETQLAAVLEAEQKRSSPRPARIEQLARTLALSASPAKAELEVAERALAGLPSPSAGKNLDTAAVLKFRMGEETAAAALLREALGRDGLSSSRVTRLAQYAEAATAHPLFLFGDAENLPPSVVAGRPMRIELDREVPGLWVLAEIRVSKGRPGFALARIPGPVSGTIEIQVPQRPNSPLPSYATLRPLIVDVEGCSCDERSVAYVVPDPRVRPLTR